jgi:hypothetical protein
MSLKELERIKNSVSAGESTSPASLKAAKREQLRKISNDRLKNWPNTLEAMRMKKETYMKDRADAEEAQRREVDRGEAELRKQSRVETIRRANDILYEQTDKMKMFRR